MVTRKKIRRNNMAIRKKPRGISLANTKKPINFFTNNNGSIVALIVCFWISLILGILAFVIVSNKNNFFERLLTYAKEWNIIDGANYLSQNVLLLFLPLVIFAIIVVAIVIFSSNKKVPWLYKKLRFFSPNLLIILLGFILGFMSIPLILFLLVLIISLISLIWIFASLLDIFIFRYVTFIFFKIVDFIITVVLHQKLDFNNFKLRTFDLFAQSVLFFCLLPYSFRFFVIIIEKILLRFGNIIFIILKPLNLLSIRNLRICTYILAFFIYMMGYAWEFELDSAFATIKESLLAFIIIDAVLFNIYENVSKKLALSQSKMKTIQGEK